MHETYICAAIKINKMQITALYPDSEGNEKIVVKYLFQPITIRCII